MIKKIVLPSLALFFVAITLVFSGCAVGQKELSKSTPTKQIPIKWQNKNSRETTPMDSYPAYALMILIVAFSMLAIGIALGSSRYERRFALPVSSIEPFFMPHEWRECTKRLYQDLQHATQKIYIASYWFTHLNIIMALEMARKRNVSVEVIFDKSTPNAETLQQQFKSIGIEFIESDVEVARMHHKFIVIDHVITWVGSANLTGTAFRKNYENMMRIQSQEIAQRYLLDFKNLMRELSLSEQKTQMAIETAYVRNKPHQLIPQARSSKAISDYQKRVLSDFGIDWQQLNYDEAYAMIGKVINSMRLLPVYSNTRKNNLFRNLNKIFRLMRPK